MFETSDVIGQIPSRPSSTHLASMRVLLAISALLAACAGLQLNTAGVTPYGAIVCSAPSPIRPAVRPRAGHSPRCQFGGGPNKKQSGGGLTRDNEPDEYFATNMGECRA